MVKVLPAAFTLFERQNIFNAPAEPLCVHCSEKYVFIACEGCLIEAHDLQKNEKMARMRTIQPVSELVYNPLGDCIVSLERRTPDSPATVRIYFKWRIIRELETPTRVISLTTPSQTSGGPMILPPVVDAEILELPVEGVSCLAVCQLTGTIAVGSEKRVHLFTLQRGRGDVPSASLSTGGFCIVTYMDVITDMKLKKICICGHYLACVSTHRVRVLKILMLGPPGVELPWEQFQLDSSRTRTRKQPPDHKEHGHEEYKNDEDFLCWSPSYVWETEARGRSSVEPSTTPTSSLDDKTKPNLPRPFLKDKTTPLIGTISISSISSSSSSFKKDSSKTELEILGPVEYIWGQPVSVVLHGDTGGGANEETKCWVVTMLYRRLASSGFSYVHTSSSLSGANSETRDRSSSVDGAPGWDSVSAPYTKSRTKGGIHSVQLVPTFTNEDSFGERKLVGMSCLFANRSKGYIYDVFNKTKQVTVLSFMTRCQTMSYDGQFLHSLSTDAESLDSYTCRISASVLANKPVASGHINTTQWLKQPCPPSSLELTLISSNKFLGCMALTSSTDHVVVFCKDTSPDTSPASSEKPSFLQSLSLRRPKVLSTVAWNVYVLVKKPVTDMFQQFSESAQSLGAGIPPVLQHHLSEAHILLRSLIIENDDSSGELSEKLRRNCFDLADSFCLYSVGEKTLNNAAAYFVLSGKPISDVIQHIKDKYSEAPTTTPFDILMKYLNLVLFEPKNRLDQLDQLQPLVNDVLQLYAKYDPERLGDFLLDSWLQVESKEKALEFCELLLTNLSQQEKTKNITSMAMVKILCDLNDREKAFKTLANVTDSFLLSWSKANPQFLLSRDSTLTLLGQVIMSKLNESFLSFFSYLFENDRISLDVVITALKVST
ncbi:PREDICTED: uncharacterized protein LOC109586604 [Amphimedon queenslandica]|uniref:Uncharacterized protein n=2 Tax=Amphimedon queenslandica TaxID=400682 RepID=A0AAN0JNL4_AMPQE|nr:PREDICTED: uncharacterized protein LOC109586604 [Amphimedon queenslandica]|eukprot:XP_019858362.1 PREDICTED: uncharacterized protein LOC109586604 [Amphimedon queenslandica]